MLEYNPTNEQLQEIADCSSAAMAASFWWWYVLRRPKPNSRRSSSDRNYLHNAKVENRSKDEKNFVSLDFDQFLEEGIDRALASDDDKVVIIAGYDGPCELLRNVERHSGSTIYTWPAKTIMIVTHDKVKVLYGYGQPYETVWTRKG